MKSVKSTIASLKIGIPSVSRRMCFTLIISCFVMTGCALIKVKNEVDVALKSTVIVGRIFAESKEAGPIIVAAVSVDEGKKVAHYSVLHESGEYELMVEQGDYYIFAYRDRNRNLIYDAGEPVGQYGDPKVVSTRKIGVTSDIDIVIPEVGKNIVIPHGFVISSPVPKKLRSRQAGVITALDDELFSDEYGAKGFWEGYSFYKEFGANIYFIEDYDPDKIPVLFIHGAGGTPKGWKYFVDNLDRTRFQPWFFYYPTGSHINGMSHQLLWKLINLQTKYQFKKIYITAHSMGGLVAKSFIVNHGRQFPYVKLFISLATPWGGDKMAEYGVQQSPVVIPSWVDMQPEGDFIKSLYRVEIPKDISFYMFSGHLGGSNLFRSNNDGTIALTSIQDFRAQSEAKMNYSFNEDHTSILFSKKVVAQYNTILNEFYEKQNTLLHQSRGYIKVRFSYDYDLEGLRPRPLFILRSVDKKESETTIYLNDGDGKTLGPFPPGKYIANMVTMAAKTRVKEFSVSIENGKTKELEFVFIPDGVIRGCVTAPVDSEEIVLGLSERRYRSVDSQIKINSVTLVGNGIHRLSQQIEGEELLNFDPFIWRVDGCYNQCFGFFGLSAGDYKVIIKAKGYKTVIKNYSVVPGVPKYFNLTELIPD